MGTLQDRLLQNFLFLHFHGLIETFVSYNNFFQKNFEYLH